VASGRYYHCTVASGRYYHAEWLVEEWLVEGTITAQWLVEEWLVEGTTTAQWLVEGKWEEDEQCCYVVNSLQVTQCIVHQLSAATLKGCSIVQKIVIEIMIKIVTEIGMEQTRLFQCNWFHCANFHD